MFNLIHFTVSSILLSFVDMNRCLNVVVSIDAIYEIRVDPRRKKRKRERETSHSFCISCVDFDGVKKNSESCINQMLFFVDCHISVANGIVYMNYVTQTARNS